jgi:L-asparaginase II
VNHELLVETTRGLDGVESVESVHYGSIAVVDAGGRLLFSAGDPDWPAFSRSTIKPFQALPLIESGGLAHFGFGAAELALMCSSHSGEAFHVEGVAAILHRAGCDESNLRCGCHVPLRYAALDRLPAADETFNQLHNNCSGKHAGFLAYCVQHDQPVADYLSPSNPLQTAIRHALSKSCDIAVERLRIGIDGCSAPNYALPLRNLALGYARLARGDSAPLRQVFDAMTAFPERVSGTGRSDLALMRSAPGDWVAKAGADGVQSIGVRSAGLGIAIKIADGNARALGVAVAETLRQLGLGNGQSERMLAPSARPPIVNARGIRCGEVRPAFSLRRR